MYLNAMRIRLGLMVAGALLFGFYLLNGGSFVLGSKSVILIEFGMYPDEFEGLEVLIDGESAGTLRRFGNAFKTGFEVEDGDHVVEVKHPEIPCRPVKVTSGYGGHRVMLIMDLEVAMAAGGRSEPTIVLTM